MGISQMAQRTLTEFFIEKGYVSSTYKNRSISLGKIRSILSQIFPEIIEDFDNGKITVKNLPPESFVNSIDTKFYSPSLDIRE